MKIVIDARILYTSTGRYVERLLEHLRDLDSENEYIVLLLDKDFDRWTPKSERFTKVIADFNPYTIAEQTSFLRLLNQLKPDLVHFTMPQHPILYIRPFVITIHDLTLIDFINPRLEGTIKDFYKQKVKPAAFSHVMRHATKASQHVITPTNFVRQQLIDRYHADPNKVTFTLESADPLAAKPTSYAPMKDKRFLLYVGNAYPYKNLERLIDAFTKQDDPDLHLVLAGKKEYFYEQLEKYVATKQIANVHFGGFVPDAELAWLYQNAELYVFPSLSEGFGLPGAEAMLYGLPLASSNATCLPEVYGDAAVYFNPQDTADMARVIKDTLADKTVA